MNVVHAGTLASLMAATRTAAALLFLLQAHKRIVIGSGRS